jgi:hypothetical protein
MIWYSKILQRLGQKKGIATEKNLLDIAKFWWYDGYEGFNTDH